MGLATQFKTRFKLLYLYYDFSDEPARDQHLTEIEIFKRRLGDEMVLETMTYQDLYSNLLAECGSEHGAYATYLGERYFPGIYGRTEG